MEFFQKANVVRLRSYHDKYMLADDDQETVYQDRNGTYKNAKWTVEIVENGNAIRCVFRLVYFRFKTIYNLKLI